MILISCVLLYLGIKKKFEPLLLVGIAFGCLLVNLSYFTGGDTSDALYHMNLWDNFLDHDHAECAERRFYRRAFRSLYVDRGCGDHG